MAPACRLWACPVPTWVLAAIITIQLEFACVQDMDSCANGAGEDCRKYGQWQGVGSKVDKGLRLQGKTVLITGASGGLGEQIAYAAAKRVPWWL